MNLFSTRVDAPLGKLLRIPLKLIPKGSNVPILFTKARGKKWIVGSGPHSCWLGFNEIRKRQLLTKLIHKGDIVFDVGANVGSYTILSSVLVGPNGKVLAFEPLPDNITYLKKHIAINKLNNVRIFEMAVSDYIGTANFNTGGDRVRGCITLEGDLVVNTTTLDEVAFKNNIFPTCIKIDVEGAEAAVLKGGLNVIRKCRPIIFVATHSPEAHKECLNILYTESYSITNIGNAEDELVAFYKNRTH